jgi:hypothetical protein
MRKIVLLLGLVLMASSGCGYIPVEPVKLERINTSEEAFLIPLTGDTTKQTATSSEDFLRRSLVLTKEVQIPYRWVQTGRYHTQGEWVPSATLIKVDRSPVTREWTADPSSGTSNRNEAVWVMTSDQVEFSTGWTITARIASREDAVRFLHNYPNGSLEKVLDSEVRGKLQATFGLEVTDLPMEELRKQATPHITKTVDEIKRFFFERGITITTLGITGGFVYKDQKILDMLTKVFNAEQERAIEQAKVLAQIERNKGINFEAEAKAKAVLIQNKAEAEGILAVAEARQKEAQVVKDNPEVYYALRKVELEKEKLLRWDGAFPHFYIGGGQGGASPDLLLQVPAFAPPPVQSK